MAHARRIERPQDFFWRGREIVNPDANGIVDGVENGWRGRDESWLTNAFRPIGSGIVGDLDMAELDVRYVERGRKRIIHETVIQGAALLQLNLLR